MLRKMEGQREREGSEILKALKMFTGKGLATDRRADA